MTPLLRKLPCVVALVAVLSTIAPLFAQTATNTLTISWSGGTGTAASGTITTREGQPTARIVYTDSNGVGTDAKGVELIYPRQVSMWTSDGGVRAPADSPTSVSTLGVRGLYAQLAAGGVGGTTFLRPGQYTAVGLLTPSQELRANNQQPWISFGGAAFTNNHCGDGDDVSGTFTLSSITVEKLSNRYHVMKLSARIDGRCSTSGIQFHITMSADEPSLGGVIVDPPGGGGAGGTNPNAPTIVLPDNVLTSTIQMPNSGSTSVPFSTFVPTTTTTDVTLTAATDANDLLATITPSVIKPGDNGNATVTIQTTATTRAGEHVVTLTASDGTASSSVSIHVTVFCDPPFILGLDQPKGATVPTGRTATLSVKPTGSGPFTYQWFNGSRGLENFPVAGGTSATLTTSALRDTASYWVRATNPCGSVDSQTATVNVSPTAKPESEQEPDSQL